MTYHKVSEKYLKDFKDMCDKKGIKYETEAEYEEAARNLVSFVDLLVEMDMFDLPISDAITDVLAQKIKR